MVQFIWCQISLLTCILKVRTRNRNWVGKSGRKIKHNFNYCSDNSYNLRYHSLANFDFLACKNVKENQGSPWITNFYSRINWAKSSLFRTRFSKSSARFGALNVSLIINSLSQLSLGKSASSTFLVSDFSLKGLPGGKLCYMLVSLLEQW